LLKLSLLLFSSFVLIYLEHSSQFTSPGSLCVLKGFLCCFIVKVLFLPSLLKTARTVYHALRLMSTVNFFIFSLSVFRAGMSD